MWSRFVKAVARLSDVAATLITGALVVTMIAQIFARRLFNDSLSWSDEFGSYMLVWIALYGSVIVLYEGKHLAIDFVMDKLKTPALNVVRIIANLCILLFVLCLFVYGVTLVEKTWDIDTISLIVSKGLIYSAIPVSAGLMIIVLVNDIIKDLLVIKGFKGGMSSC